MNIPNTTTRIKRSPLVFAMETGEIPLEKYRIVYQTGIDRKRVEQGRDGLGDKK